MDMPLFEKKTGYVECKLCPHRCRLKEGEVGKCFVRKCDGDSIFLSNYGELTSISIDPIEKKPFHYFLPKTKTVSIGGIGCNLRCLFCENHEISQVEYHPLCKIFAPEKIVEIAEEKNYPSVCMTFNEPIISFEYLIDLAEACHKRDIKFILKTNAYVNEEPWRAICEVVDAMNIDWKGCDIQYSKITGAKEFVIMDRIREAYEAGVHLEISIPLYYSFLEDMRIFFQCAQFLGSLDRNIPCHLLKVNPAYRFSDHVAIDDTSYKLARDIIQVHMLNVSME